MPGRSESLSEKRARKNGAGHTSVPSLTKCSEPAFDDASAWQRRRPQPLVLQRLEGADGQVAHVCVERGAHGCHAVTGRGEPHAGMVVRELSG